MRFVVSPFLTIDTSFIKRDSKFDPDALGASKEFASVWNPGQYVFVLISSYVLSAPMCAEPTEEYFVSHASGYNRNPGENAFVSETLQEEPFLEQLPLMPNLTVSFVYKTGRFQTQHQIDVVDNNAELRIFPLFCASTIAFSTNITTVTASISSG